MNKFVVMIGTMLVSLWVSAHEMTPTYPNLSPSHVKDVFHTTMELFNRRQEVEFYEIGVFDSEFNPIPFVSSYKIIRVDYLDKVTFDIYIRKTDVSRSTYICSRSKLRKDDDIRTAISSRICSKFK